MRIIFFTGKGGVGKTSTAAATAVLSAERGHRTIIMSTDPAHSLADSIGVALGPNVINVLPNLDAIEIDPYVELNEYWGKIREFLASFLVTMGADAQIAGELASIPGMDELFSLIRLREFYGKQEYDVVIVDMAPTGESLRLLSLPEVLAWILKVTRTLERFITAPVLRPISKIAPGLDKIVAPEDVVALWDRSLDRLNDIRQILDEKAVTSARLVMNPEKMVIAESRRSLTYLNLYGMRVDAAIVNKVIPHDAKEGYLEDWYESQQEYLKMIEADFAPMPTFSAPLFRSEVTGIERLRMLGNLLYGNDADPTELFYDERPISIRYEPDGAVLRVKLPFAPTENLELSRVGSTLVLTIGRRVREIVLPDSLAALDPKDGSFVDGYLEIKFWPAHSNRSEKSPTTSK
ncbi:arsenite-activated ATPase ArsA [Chloroherpeton thalassium ATCC 35110]|uniref:arsenite-transporting ATPase n=1 Tax=Chloroherpeton thalassium (strain ATCC 35110 / GB-78) TaxID=517418 RepID=B3QS08_CHLT3|nr:ArsA family ATPase [Chloroherpeton thalassium]ACF13953.1 arsenite-activated ATPase ArsA [Chloroherpeton thalassium ATCC 35110]